MINTQELSTELFENEHDRRFMIMYFENLVKYQAILLFIIWQHEFSFNPLIHFILENK